MKYFNNTLGTDTFQSAVNSCEKIPKGSTNSH